jgi:alanine racemase
VYGIAPAPALVDRLALEPALQLATEVAFVKRLAAGERVSYGLLHAVERDTTVVTLPIGYADGVPRRLGIEGQPVLIGGCHHPMIGVVTMDQLLVDVGPDADVQVGDEVVLLGAQQGHRIAPDEWAAQLGTISYEVVCGLGARVERRYGPSTSAGS